ncbi:MAG: hypothetical protein FWG63_00550, partial [Defluviitaleaceae bacterium]|nr:hypothetical protein [Defluviitaleaceae bacterium]
MRIKRRLLCISSFSAKINLVRFAGGIIDKDISQDNSKQDKIYWHDAFYAALQLELYDYKDVLTFEDEHQLSKEALKMDVLIIKKTADV